MKIPRLWKDELLQILLTQGFDAVIKQLEEWFEEEEKGDEEKKERIRGIKMPTYFGDQPWGIITGREK